MGDTYHPIHSPYSRETAPLKDRLSQQLLHGKPRFSSSLLPTTQREPVSRGGSASQRVRAPQEPSKSRQVLPQGLQHGPAAFLKDEVRAWTLQELSSRRHLPNPGTEPRSPTWQVESLLSEPPGQPHHMLQAPECSVVSRNLSLLSSFPSVVVKPGFPPLELDERGLCEKREAATPTPWG